MNPICFVCNIHLVGDGREVVGENNLCISYLSCQCGEVHYCSLNCTKKDYDIHQKKCKIELKKELLELKKTTLFMVPALPDEILTCILIFVGLIDVINFRRVSKRFRRLCSEEYFMKEYCHELCPHELITKNPTDDWKTVFLSIAKGEPIIEFNRLSRRSNGRNFYLQIFYDFRKEVQALSFEARDEIKDWYNHRFRYIDVLLEQFYFGFVKSFKSHHEKDSVIFTLDLKATARNSRRYGGNKIRCKKVCKLVVSKEFIIWPKDFPMMRTRNYEPIEGEIIVYEKSVEKHPPGSPVETPRINPCFAGESLVLLGDGKTEKRVDQLKKGDLIYPDNREVKCVLQTTCLNGKEELVELGSGLLITPEHPVRVNDCWMFPNQLGAAIERKCDFVYSFVLDFGHTMLINGIECICLGHGFRFNSVVQHDYFGNEKVIRDLKKMKGWEIGLIKFDYGCCFTDKAGRVVGLIEKD